MSATNLRTFPRLLLTASAAVFCTFAVPAPVHAQAPQYTVTVLGPGEALGINDSGQVVGQAYYLGESSPQATLWTGTTQTQLGIPGSEPTYGSFAVAINNSGVIVGYANNGPALATVWTGTTPTSLNGGVYGVSSAFGINASGQVAGSSSWAAAYTAPYPETHATQWTGTTPTDLGTLPGGFGFSVGLAINASGQVAGLSYNPGTNATDGVLWSGGSMTDLGISNASGINDSGVVVGWSGLQAVEWTPAGITNLNTLGGNLNSVALGINNSGEVTGLYGQGNLYSLTTPFLYTGGLMYDLSSLLVPGSGVTGLTLGDNSTAFNPTGIEQPLGGDTINASGQIAATGYIDGQMEALLLTPVEDVPEPSTWVSLAMSVGVLLALRRRTPKEQIKAALD